MAGPTPKEVADLHPRSASAGMLRVYQQNFIKSSARHVQNVRIPSQGANPEMRSVLAAEENKTGVQCDGAAQNRSSSEQNPGAHLLTAANTKRPFSDTVLPPDHLHSERIRNLVQIFLGTILPRKSRWRTSLRCNMIALNFWKSATPGRGLPTPSPLRIGRSSVCLLHPISRSRRRNFPVWQ